MGWKTHYAGVTCGKRLNRDSNTLILARVTCAPCLTALRECWGEDAPGLTEKVAARLAELEGSD